MKAFFKKSSLLSIAPLLIFLITPSFLSAQINANYYDGPYIFSKKDSLHLQWVERGIGKDTIIAKKNAGVFKIDSLPLVNLQKLDFETDQKASYDQVDKIIAVSDVHGQYDLLIRLLQAHGVIDHQRQWTYGDGHLVVIGDNFDRGDRVLDLLWFLFYLQKEAETVGGKVHMLLGNHEVMVLNGDLRYIHEKYNYTSAIFTTPYDQFFRKGSVLGDWIASHKIMTSINQRLFVHAGISPAVLKLGYSMEKMNKVFRNQVIRQPDKNILKEESLSILYAEDGPVWYRGYFESPMLNMETIENILKGFNQKTIIVGHTSMEEIKSLFEGKIIAIDCNIRMGKDGQLLIIEKDNLFIGDLEGERIVIDYEEKPAKQSLFDYIYTLDSLPKLKIKTDIGRLIKKRRSEEYQGGSIGLSSCSGKEMLSLSGRLRARGNTRKKVCVFPPVKLDFKKSLLDSLGFHKIDKLKLVFPCSKGKSQQELLYKEFFVYNLYALIDSNCLRAKLIDISIGDEKKKNYEFVGFLIEDEAEYARRKGARILDKATINSSSLDRESFVKMEFFQYMISNTDWSLRNKHNLELVKLPGMERATAIAYDFDYSGFVGQQYAIPHKSLPIETVHDRYFFSYPISEKEFYEMVDYFLSIEKEVYTLCEKATYLSSKSIDENKEYLADFFKLLKNPKSLRMEMVRE